MFETYESESYEGETFELPGEAGLPGESYENYESYENEALEGELAQRLLEVSSEEELDRFLGSLARSVVKGASSFIKSPVGQALGGVLKKVAKTALPAVGGALGSLVLPGAGTAIGAKLGSLAGGLLEVGEAEMLGESEAQYEAAQRYVRFARASMGLASRAPRGMPPWSVARAATTTAARRHAPTLLRGDRGGQWRQRRRGNQRPYPLRPTYAAWSPYEPAPRAYPFWLDDTGDAWAGGQDDAGPGSPDGGDGAWSETTAETAGGPPSGSGRSPALEGRWVRRGQRIVILGV